MRNPRHGEGVNLVCNLVDGRVTTVSRDCNEKLKKGVQYPGLASDFSFSLLDSGYRYRVEFSDDVTQLNSPRNSHVSIRVISRKHISSILVALLRLS